MNLAPQFISLLSRKLSSQFYIRMQKRGRTVQREAGVVPTKSYFPPL